MYSKINYQSLIQMAERALNELSTYSLDSIQNSLNSSSVLPSEIRKSVNSAIKDINKNKAYTASFESLRNNLKLLINVGYRIQDYQKKEAEIKRFIAFMDDEKSSHQRKLKKLQRELKEIKEGIEKVLA